MLNNLKAEMARANVSTSEIAALSGRSCRTITDRLKGKGQFPIQDAIKVKNAFFPGMDLEYLFTASDLSQDSVAASAQPSRAQDGA